MRNRTPYQVSGFLQLQELGSVGTVPQHLKLSLAVAWGLMQRGASRHLEKLGHFGIVQDCRARQGCRAC